MSSNLNHFKRIQQFESIFVQFPIICIIFYAGWTLNIHLSQFFKLSWQQATDLFYFVGPLFLLLAVFLANKFWNSFNTFAEKMRRILLQLTCKQLHHPVVGNCI